MTINLSIALFAFYITPSDSRIRGKKGLQKRKKKEETNCQPNSYFILRFVRLWKRKDERGKIPGGGKLGICRVLRIVCRVL